MKSKNHDICKFLWAKKKEINGEYFWLPLEQHLEDTKNVISYLWEHWLSDSQKDLVNKSTDYKGKEVSIFIAYTHDIGKATPAFQTTKNTYQQPSEIDSELLYNLESYFPGIYYLKLSSPRSTPHSLASQYILKSFGVKDDVSTIVGGHHGKTIDDKVTLENQESYKSNYFQSEYDGNQLGINWREQHENILKKALFLSSFSCVSEIPNFSQPAQVILLGLLIMADWIASNERYFPLIEIDCINVDNKIQRYQEGVSAWVKNQKWIPEALSDSLETYNNRFHFNRANEFQNALFELVESSNDSEIFIIEAPMGIGKTEAALITSEQLAFYKGMSGIFFGLPTQATSNGIFKRILDWMKNFDLCLNENLSLRLVHGKAALNEDFYKLANGINYDDSENGNVIVNEWFNGKKTSSLDDFVVGTVDQFLMLSLKQKHLALRHLGFSKKVIIIDEVHAYDAYMNQYLMRSLTWMGSYGVPVIILSATLPHSRRFELVKNYLKGKGIKKEKDEWNLISSSLKTNCYPVVTYNSGGEIKQKTDFESTSFSEVEVVKIFDKSLEAILRIIDFKEGVVGIIVNTVKKAQELARLCSSLFGEENILLIHSSFIATDRIKKENDLIKLIGKNALRPEFKIIIGTQVIEQSLDIDFDILISELAPVDLLIQRLGRLHRHTINRPICHKHPKFYVVGCSNDLEFDEGTEFIYGGFLLTRTQYFLPNKIILPRDIPFLVQTVYDFEFTAEGEILEKKKLNLGNVLTPIYNKFKINYSNFLEDKNNRAKSFRVDEPILKQSKFKKSNLIGWQKNNYINESEEIVSAQVRDIQDSIEVVALKKVGDGYGIFDEAVDISCCIEDLKVAKKVAKNTLRLPNIFNYAIDKHIRELELYNVKNLSVWQEISWLKGTLGIIFDENGKFTLNGIKIRYTKEIGLEVIKEDISE